MTAPPAWLVLAVPLLIAQLPKSVRTLRGPMPQLTAPIAPDASVPDAPAPVPDQDAIPPAEPRSGGGWSPALIDRSRGGAPATSGYAPGSAYSPEQARQHGGSGSDIGNVLAPGLQLRVPLQ